MCGRIVTLCMHDETLSEVVVILHFLEFVVSRTTWQGRPKLGKCILFHKAKELLNSGGRCAFRTAIAHRPLLLYGSLSKQKDFCYRKKRFLSAPPPPRVVMYTSARNSCFVPQKLGRRKHLSEEDRFAALSALLTPIMLRTL